MKSVEELRRIRDDVRKTLAMRAGGHRAKIVVGMGTCGIAAGARETLLAFMTALDEASVSDVAVTATGCAGFCDQEPLVDVEVPGQPTVRYGRVNAAAARRIVTEHILGGKKVDALVIA
ncbi:MAG TPA: (2Fe-2S) ferredoxin domain-containing protein [Spirochaetia bacterium]